MDPKEEIRSRVNIEDVIGEYVQLKRAGRNFKGLSPFSQEKSPSFMVSPEKHIWHDFSSGRGGDVFSFVMEMEGLDFKGALQLLARKAGVDLGQFQSGGESGAAKKKERLLAASALAVKFYQQVLVRSTAAVDYIKKRGFNKQVVADFGIGFSPGDNQLYRALSKRGFTETELKAAGLLAARRQGPGDMFRNRLMICLADPQGRPIGFTARIITSDPNAPKYINTPQTLLYDKGRHVFGLHLAKEAIRQSGFTVVVEGNADVIASHQAGVKNVVATAGTALTEHHLRGLSRFTQDVRLAFDADRAGISATERAIAIASNLGINLGIVSLPEDSGAKDPDELIKKDVSLWQKAIASPQDAVSWLLKVYASRFDLASAAGKRQATDQALEVIKNIHDPVLLEHYINLVAAAVGASPQALNKKLSQTAKPLAKTQLKRPKPPPLPPEHFSYQDHLLAMAWQHPELRDSLKGLEPEYFEGRERQAIAVHLKSGGDLLQSDAVNVKIGELELIAAAKYAALSDELYFDASYIAKRTKREHKQVLRAGLAEQLFSSEDQTTRSDINKRIKALDQEIEALKH